LPCTEDAKMIPRAVLPLRYDDLTTLAPQTLEAQSKSAAQVIAHAHRLQPLDGKPVGTLLIHEIYRSLQGESTFAGLPCVFVRLTACNLRCSYCDTAYAFTEGKKQSSADILAEIWRL